MVRWIRRFQLSGVDDRRPKGRQFLVIAVGSEPRSSALFVTPSRELTGHFLIDDVFLSERGVTDFDVYRVDPTSPLAPDFFVPDDTPVPPGVSMKALT